MQRRGDELHASVARRAVAVKVPRVTGMTPSAARELIERAQLRVGDTTTAADAQTPAGLVIDTQPAEGTDAPRLKQVALRVSSGAALAAVPQLFGRKLGSAKELLEKAGFVLGTIKHGSNEHIDRAGGAPGMHGRGHGQQQEREEDAGAHPGNRQPRGPVVP